MKTPAWWSPRPRPRLLGACLLGFCTYLPLLLSAAPAPAAGLTLNLQDTGYRGIWYQISMPG